MTIGQLIERLSEMDQKSEVAIQITKQMKDGDVDKIIYVSRLHGFDKSHDEKTNQDFLWLCGLIED